MSLVTFKEHGSVIRMMDERDCTPFDEYIVGYFDKGEDGYYEFNASEGVRMSCKHLRVAADKASELNIKG